MLRGMHTDRWTNFTDNTARRLSNPSLADLCSAAPYQIDVSWVRLVVQHRPIGGINDKPHRTAWQDRVSKHPGCGLVRQHRFYKERAWTVSFGLGIGCELRLPVDFHNAG